MRAHELEAQRAAPPAPPQRRSRNPVDRLTQGLPRPLRIAVDWIVTIAGAVAIALLTGCPAGEPGEDGTYPADTVNGLVEARLVELAELAREYAREPEEEGAAGADPAAEPGG